MTPDGQPNSSAIPASGRADREDLSRLEVSKVSKAFEAVLAVNDVSVEFKGSQVHALLGENGAGKSTLIRLIAGDHRPDSGEIRLDGQPLMLAHPQEAFEHGIACVHQTPAFAPRLSVTENLFLGLPFGQRRAGLIDWAAEHRAARDALSQVGLSLDPYARLADLAPHERQFVALARALQHNPRVMLLDEITASLAEPELRLLYEVIGRVLDRGVAVVYVTHRLEEVFDVAHVATVLRDGRHIATVPVEGLTHRRLTEYIVGRKIDEVIPERQDTASGQTTGSALVARDVGDGEHTAGISFDVRSGEVLGIAGLAGSGQSELLRLLFGAEPLTQGEMLLEGEPYAPKHPTEAIARNVAMVTEDRHFDGFCNNLPVWKNITLPWVQGFRRRGFLRLRTERATAGERADRFGVRMPSIDASMSQLSGGNQQKVVLAKWVSESPRVLILDEPTHGVDIRSRYEIYDLVQRLAARGVAIIVASSELEELEILCDRVLLLRGGRVVGELRGSDVNEGVILSSLLATTDSRPEDDGVVASHASG
jgi:ABC-type sugar transport system ATPase subunit